MTKLHGSLMFAFGLGVLLASGSARAQVDSGEDHRYGYEFDDDLLSSDVRPPQPARLGIRVPYRGAGLIRPRVSFVPEALKSIERM